MSKKHYVQLVRVIKDAQIPDDPNTLDMGKLLVGLCNFLKTDNKLFDEDKFYEAVYKSKDSK